MPNEYYENYGYNQELPTNDMQYILNDKLKQDKPDVTTVLGAAASDAVSLFAMKRMYDRRGDQYEKDEAWNIDDKTVNELQKEYSEDDEKYIREAKSEAEFVSRKKDIEEDRERKQIIAQSGLVGTAATLGFSLLDPTSLALGMATGGIGWGSKLTGISKALRIATMSGLENAAVESILIAGNTQSSAMDVISAFGMGAAIGGVVGSFSKVDKDLTDSINVNESVAFDEAIKNDSDFFIANSVLTDVRDKELGPLQRTFEGVDHGAVSKAMEEYEQKLKKHEMRPLSSTDIGEVRTKIQKTKDKIKFEQKRINNIQKELEADRTAIIKEQKKFIKEANPVRDSINKRFSKKIKEAEANINKAVKRVEKKNTPKNNAKLWESEMKLQSIKKEMRRELQVVEDKLNSAVKKAEWKFQRKFSRRTTAFINMKDTLETELHGYRQQIKDHVKAKKFEKVSYSRWKTWGNDYRAKLLFGDKPPMMKDRILAELENNQPVVPLQTVVDKKTVDIERIPGRPEASTVTEDGFVSTGSVGAMEAGGKQLHRIHEIRPEAQQELARFAYEAGKIPEGLRGKQLLPKFTRMLQGVHTRLINSDNMAVRGLAYHLFEAPQGGKANKFTASIRSAVYNRRIRGAMKNRLNEATTEYAEENGIPIKEMLLKPDNIESFNKQVITEVKYPGTYSNASIVKASEGIRDQLKEAGKLMQDSGVKGFENIDLDANYFPTIMNETLIKRALREHGHYNVRKTLSEGYQNGKYKLNKFLSDFVADGYIQRAKDHTLTVRDYIRTSTSLDAEKVAKQLEEAGVPKEVIEEFMDISSAMNLKKHVSNRSKKSLEPDIRVEYNGLKLIDMVDSDIEKQLESYTRDAAGGSALAKIGFKTRAEAMEFLNNIEKSAENNGLNPITTAEEVQVLKDGIDLILGRSINENPHSALVRWTSRLRDATAFLRLQNLGLSTIPEVARVTTSRGVSGVLEACPSLGLNPIKGSKGIRLGNKYSGEITVPDIKEIDQMLHYVGEDHALYSNGLRADNIEEAESFNRLGSIIDRSLSQGRRVQEVLSGFRAVQGGGEKIATRALANHIKKWVDGTGDALRQADINNAGWHDGFLDNVKDWMTTHPATDVYKGDTVRLFNFDKMPIDMQERLIIGMHRIVGREMQRAFVGETPVFMHKWLGQSLMQFRSFSLISFEKQLMHDIRHDRAAGAVTFLHSAMLGYMSLAITAAKDAIGRDDSMDYFKNRMTGSNLVMGVFNRMGQVASAGIALDGLATLGAIPDEMMAAPGQMGYRGLTSTSVPIIGLVSDAKDVTTDLTDILKGNGEHKQTVKDIQNILPFAKSIGINQAFNIIFDL